MNYGGERHIISALLIKSTMRDNALDVYSTMTVEMTVGCANL